MPFTTVAEFKHRMMTEPLEGIVKEVIFQGEPFAFRNLPQHFDTLKKHLNTSLGTKEENITIIGSGKIGFSLAPDSPFRAYNEGSSDIDVLVVDPVLFDTVWHSMLAWHYERDRTEMNSDERRWIGERRKSLYWGWLQPDDLKTPQFTMFRVRLLERVREVRGKWFNAFKTLESSKHFRNYRIDGRLYRSWEHAAHYHIDGLSILKKSL
jgi:hypothetical protein